MMSRTEMSTYLRSSSICSREKHVASPVTALRMSEALTPENMGRSAFTSTSRPSVCTLTPFPRTCGVTHCLMAVMRAAEGLSAGVLSAAVRSPTARPATITLCTAGGRFWPTHRKARSAKGQSRRADFESRDFGVASRRKAFQNDALGTKEKRPLLCLKLVRIHTVSSSFRDTLALSLQPARFRSRHAGQHEGLALGHAPASREGLFRSPWCARWFLGTLSRDEHFTVCAQKINIPRFAWGAAATPEAQEDLPSVHPRCGQQPTL
jgi:hypothetical protein